MFICKVKPKQGWRKLSLQTRSEPYQDVIDLVQPSCGLPEYRFTVRCLAGRLSRSASDAIPVSFFLVHFTTAYLLA